jgi:hypothetical protein
MKKIFLALFTMIACNAHAGLLTQVSDQATYNNGDNVLVNFYINDANAAIDWLHAEYYFDNTQLSFNGLTITNDVYDNTYYDDAYSVGNLLTLDIGFLSDWQLNLGNSFLLGQMSFTALANNVGATFQLEDIYAQNADFADVELQQGAQSVPEPSLLALMLLSLVTLISRRAIRKR